MRRSPIRSWLPALAGTALVTVLGAALAPPVSAAAATEAAPAYKYWGYYHGSGGDWEFSMKGAHEYIPKDGSVEGWRYGLADVDGRTPRAMPDFASVCGDETASGGRKLVAVVIDYGIQEEAEGSDETPPARGACANVEDGASGQQVLQSVAGATTGDAGIASIDGYPSVPTTESFDGADIPASEPPVELVLTDDSTEEAADEEAADTTDEDDGPPWALVGVGAVAVLIAGGAFVVPRRRS